AAALAVLDVMEQEHLVQNADRVGSYLIEKLSALRLPHVVEVRGRGLMIGVELDIPYKEVRNRLVHEQHCFTGCSGTTTLRLLPPLCLCQQEADDFCQRLAAVLQTV
ncbi:MAG: aminotransferase class III-fold pyridoxal phosphate-dependent enzyme, partial [Bacteroidaceae bacterium]|nr:aminotransferase class III-fold pyridoxal phosphate-dependent enzyme [Bacteroidaceae bacterium]